MIAVDMFRLKSLLFSLVALALFVPSFVLAAPVELNTGSVDLEKSNLEALYITDTAQTGLDLSGSFTIEVWFKLESQIATANSQCFVVKGNAAASNLAYRFCYTQTFASIRMQTQVSSDGTNTSGKLFFNNAPNYTFTVGDWYHVAVVFDTTKSDAQKFRYFINGAPHGYGTSSQNQTGTIGVHNSNGDLLIGADILGTTSGHFDGLIDHVRIWNSARSDANIATYYNLLFPDATATNVVAEWELDGDTTDKSGNNNWLNRYGATAWSTDTGFSYQYDYGDDCEEPEPPLDTTEEEAVHVGLLMSLIGVSGTDFLRRIFMRA